MSSTKIASGLSDLYCCENQFRNTLSLTNASSHCAWVSFDAAVLHVLARRVVFDYFLVFQPCLSC